MKVNDYNFKLVEKGKGETLLFVHGSVSDYRTWDLQLEAFSNHFQCIAYSRRFHYPNEPIAEGEDYSMLQHVDDLDGIIKSIGRPVHLVGHSYGAFVCLLLAMKSPALLKSLVLAEPSAITLFVSNKPKLGELIHLLFTNSKTAFAILKFGAKGIGPATRMIRKDNWIKAIEYFGKAVLGNEAYSKISTERKEQVMKNLIKSEFLGSRYPPLDEKKIRNISIPTLLLEGENSPSLFHFILNRLEQLLQQSKRVSVPNASHISHEDNPEFYNKTVLNFINSHIN